MLEPASGVLRALPSGGISLKASEADAILEIAFLAIASDHKLRDEELAAFRAVADRLRELAGTGGKLSQREFELVLERFGPDLDRDTAEARLRLRGGELAASDTKRLAYKVAYALALCDLDTSDEEFEFDLQLIEALDLSGDDAAALEDEVLDAMQGEDE